MLFLGVGTMMFHLQPERTIEAILAYAGLPLWTRLSHTTKMHGCRRATMAAGKTQV